MLVEPIPIRPFRRGGRQATIFLVIGPLLAIMLPAAVTPHEAKPRPPEQAQVVVPSTEPSEGGGAASPDDFPAAAMGLQVQTVAQALEARVLGDVASDLVAVSGFLSNAPSGAECVEPGPPGDSSPVPCQRSIVLIDHPGPSLNATPDPKLPPTTAPDLGEPHLDASIPPESALAEVLGPSGDPSLSALRSIAVVLIGRLGRPSGTCVAAAGWCRGDIAIERVVWVGGQWRDWVFLSDPA
ncbi:MAG: hypothetical protein L0221_01635 [Chloroflexi bacterium]|nr:hypothetical protein [Chloroflexota bacterium]